MTFKLEVDTSKPVPAVLPDFDDFFESAELVKFSDKINPLTALDVVDAIDKADRSQDICIGPGRFAFRTTGISILHVQNEVRDPLIALQY